MPGTTDIGAPYPLDSDPAADGAATIQALAEWLSDTLKGFQAGQVAVVVGASTAPASVDVVFDEPYASQPVVVVSQSAGSPHFYAAWASAITTTGFTMNAEKTGTSGGASITGRWHAMGVIA